MRDQQVYEMHEATARRSMLILRQFEVLNTRQLSIEHVLRTGLGRLYFLFNPSWFWRSVDAHQQVLLAECRRQLEKVMEQPKITVVR
jgi:hypothetical protein